MSVGDVVYTPGWVVDDMIAHFNPTGTVLDPCRGKGAFHDRLPEGSPWCEITDGRDFFDWHEPVDWIIGNPPFSKSSAWFRHSFDLAEHVLYVLPLRHMFSAYGRLTDLLEWGGVQEIRLYGGGARIGFPMGNVVGAVHMTRGYAGPTSWTDQKKESSCLTSPSALPAPHDTLALPLWGPESSVRDSA